MRWGAGPRAGQALVLAAKARALLHGRFAATRDDVGALAAPVLRHRLLLSFAAEAEQRSTDDIVAACCAPCRSPPEAGDARASRMTVASLIPPELRARLKPLRLDRALLALRAGHRPAREPRRGAGLEFAQYRAYEPGDEPRHIDWKLYARSDRYFVRDAERDSPLTAWLLVDATASMAQADAARPRVHASSTRRRRSRPASPRSRSQQGDSFGLVTVGGERRRLAGGKRTRGIATSCGARSTRSSAGSQLPDEAALRPLLERIAPAALLVILSDGFDETLVALAERLAAARREVLVRRSC